MLFLAAAACTTGARPETAPAPAEPPAVRTLVLMLDGVPFQVMDSLRSAGHFAAFQRPSRVISPFPSLTGISFTEMWGAPPNAGYEDKWYDPVSNRVRGGVIDHALGDDEPAGFRKHVDVELNGLLENLSYVAPVTMARFELRELRDAIIARAQRDTVVVGYVIATDAYAHREGRAALVGLLLEVERIADELRGRFGPDVEVVLFSDHGNELVPTQRVPLEAALRTAGYRRARSLQSSRDVVIPRYGLVGSAFLYTTPDAMKDVAAAVVRVPGVDLVVFTDEADRAHVLSRRGRAYIESNGSLSAYRYVPLDGDPLGLEPAMARMRAEGVLDQDGFAQDSAWLQASLESPYIDGPRRILAARRAVRHPASLIVSFETGFHYGDPAASFFLDVVGTHGSLRTAASEAFLMSTRRQAPPLLRGENVWRHLPPR
jgi:hypothetical protein